MDETTKKILEIVTGIQERLEGTATKEGLAANTKAIEELRETIEPLAKAVDKDAETIIKHETRIAHIEKRLVAHGD